jgi:uncharacterized membrane protein YdjX (TVP38/TMEM64 family)
MILSRDHGAAHFLALASATAAVVGLRFDDLKWAISIIASMFGSAVALYIFRGKMRAHAELLARVDAELRRLREHSARNGEDEAGGDWFLEDGRGRLK